MDNRLNGLNPLAYQGVAPLSVPQLVFFNDDPTTSDSKNFSIGCIWVNRTANSVWILVNLAQGVATWIKFASSSGFASSFPTDSGTAVPTALGALTVAGGTNINTAGSGNTVTVNLDNSISLSGTITAVGTITSTAGNVDVTTGDVNVTDGAVHIGSVDPVQPALLQFLKSDNGGAVTSGEQLGFIDVSAFDGTGLTHAASIVVTSTGTIAANQVPGVMSFNTHPLTAGAVVTRMVIGASGNVTINAPDTGAALTVSGTITGTTLYASGDDGGVAATNALSNVTNQTANGAGVFTILSKSANSANSTGFLKIYVGTTAFWVPFFADPAP